MNARANYARRLAAALAALVKNPANATAAATAAEMTRRTASTDTTADAVDSRDRMRAHVAAARAASDASPGNEGLFDEARRLDRIYAHSQKLAAIAQQSAQSDEARAAELDAAHRRAAARETAYAAAHPPKADRPATPAQRPAGKKRKPSPKAAKRPPLDVTAQALAEAPVRIATYSPSVFLEPAYAAYALAYFTRCARYDCPGRPEHADEGAAAAYLHLISRDYAKAGKQRGKATRNRISSHLHALRSAKYQARRRNWYAPSDTNDTNRREKRQYCPGMGSQYQYGTNPATIARTLETAERIADEHAEMLTTRERRRHIWPDSGAKGRRPARLATAEVSLNEYAEAIRTGAE